MFDLDASTDPGQERIEPVRPAFGSLDAVVVSSTYHLYPRHSNLFYSPLTLG